MTRRAESAVSPRAAYVHVPFCRHRCGYCNFTLVAKRDDLIDAYLAAIERELQTLGEPHEVETLFFGGGTPTHLPAAQLRRLFDVVKKHFPLATGYEFSVEANPIDLIPETLELLVEAGVTRISLGVQSFDDAKLQLLERDHRRSDIFSTVERLRGRFESVSLDLIFGVPGETLGTWQADLAQALTLAPQHVSTYGLTFERGTSFWSRQSKGELASLDEELERQMYETAIDTLIAAGYQHYEVSNFARPGFRCRHNETYWLGRGYFAAGPGASRFVNGRRETNHRSTTTYIQRVLAGQSPVCEAEELSPEDAARERLVFGLRRIDGVDRDEFHAETGYAIDPLGGRALQRALAADLLTWSANRLQLTRAGLLVSDALWPDFLRP